MSDEDKWTAKMIVLILVLLLLSVVAAAWFRAEQVQACLEAGKNWSNGNCWEDQ